LAGWNKEARFVQAMRASRQIQQLSQSCVAPGGVSTGRGAVPAGAAPEAGLEADASI
jgi:hypothetical protein